MDRFHVSSLLSICTLFPGAHQQPCSRPRHAAAGRPAGRANLFWAATLSVLLAGCFSLSSCSSSQTSSPAAGQAARPGAPAASVDPIIGTGKGPGGPQNLFPGATVPFGMVQLSPDTESHGFGYHYYQADIQGFSMDHMSGPGGSNEGNVFFTATTGPVKTALAAFESPYSHSQESASAGYYRVRLSRWGVKAELTATNRTGLARFTFPAGKEANILLPISHTLHATDAARVRIAGKRRITGYVESEIWSKKPYKTYFVITFSRPFSSFGTWHGNQPQGPGELSVHSRTVAQTRPGQWVGAYVRWPAASHSQTVVAKIGISYVDLAGAENNLQQESANKTFAQVRHDAWSTWNKALSVIQVSGGSARDRVIFYTALYHSLLMPTVFNDADGRYVGFDNKVRHVAPGHLIYCNYSGWDIYRSEMPLLALIEPQRMEDMARSIVLMYQQGGWIGRWPSMNGYTGSMAGSPLSVVLAMDWLDGLHGFNIQTAWKGMVLDATQAPPSGAPSFGESGIRWINKVHYVPAHKVRNKRFRNESVSQIQEDCIAYASLCDLARDLGKTRAAARFYKRALYYRNVFDPQDCFFRPRNAAGHWTPRFDPSQMKHGFIEGSGWQYLWLAPSDMAWLVHAMGRNLFNQRLEKFFSYKTPGWYGQYYNPYNETDLQAPFEFNFSGMPWETQRVVRRVLKENYTTAYDGIPGNDDCGEMSSWAVMSMMGIYTVDPASLAYELASPLFSKIVIHLHAPYPGKEFTIRASSNPVAKPYIQSVKLNGQSHQKNWLRFGKITAGGTLQFTLGPAPNKSWGSAAADAPPSLSSNHSS